MECVTDKKMMKQPPSNCLRSDVVSLRRNRKFEVAMAESKECDVEVALDDVPRIVSNGFFEFNYSLYIASHDKPTVTYYDENGNTVDKNEGEDHDKQDNNATSSSTNRDNNSNTKDKSKEKQKNKEKEKEGSLKGNNQKSDSGDFDDTVPDVVDYMGPESDRLDIYPNVEEVIEIYNQEDSPGVYRKVDDIYKMEKVTEYDLYPKYQDDKSYSNLEFTNLSFRGELKKDVPKLEEVINLYSKSSSFNTTKDNLSGDDMISCSSITSVSREDVSSTREMDDLNDYFTEAKRSYEQLLLGSSCTLYTPTGTKNETRTYDLSDSLSPVKGNSLLANKTEVEMNNGQNFDDFNYLKYLNFMYSDPRKLQQSGDDKSPVVKKTDRSKNDTNRNNVDKNKSKDSMKKLDNKNKMEVENKKSSNRDSNSSSTSTCTGTTTQNTSNVNETKVNKVTSKDKQVVNKDSKNSKEDLLSKNKEKKEGKNKNVQKQDFKSTTKKKLDEESPMSTSSSTGSSTEDDHEDKSYPKKKDDRDEPGGSSGKDKKGANKNNNNGKENKDKNFKTDRSKNDTNIKNTKNLNDKKDSKDKENDENLSCSRDSVGADVEYDESVEKVLLTKKFEVKMNEESDDSKKEVVEDQNKDKQNENGVEESKYKENRDNENMSNTKDEVNRMEVDELEPYPEDVEVTLPDEAGVMDLDKMSFEGLGLGLYNKDAVDKNKKIYVESDGSENKTFRVEMNRSKSKTYSTTSSTSRDKDKERESQDSCRDVDQETIRLEEDGFVEFLKKNMHFYENKEFVNDFKTKYFLENYCMDYNPVTIVNHFKTVDVDRKLLSGKKLNVEEFKKKMSNVTSINRDSNSSSTNKTSTTTNGKYNTTNIDKEDKEMLKEVRDKSREEADLLSKNKEKKEGKNKKTDKDMYLVNNSNIYNMLAKYMNNVKHHSVNISSDGNNRFFTDSSSNKYSSVDVDGNIKNNTFSFSSNTTTKDISKNKNSTKKEDSKLKKDNTTTSSTGSNNDKENKTESNKNMKISTGKDGFKEIMNNSRELRSSGNLNKNSVMTRSRSKSVEKDKNKNSKEKELKDKSKVEADNKKVNKITSSNNKDINKKDDNKHMDKQDEKKEEKEKEVVDKFRPPVDLDMSNNFKDLVISNEELLLLKDHGSDKERMGLSDNENYMNSSHSSSASFRSNRSNFMNQSNNSNLSSSTGFISTTGSNTKEDLFNKDKELELLNKEKEREREREKGYSNGFGSSNNNNGNNNRWKDNQNSETVDLRDLVVFSNHMYNLTHSLGSTFSDRLGSSRNRNSRYSNISGISALSGSSNKGSSLDLSTGALSIKDLIDNENYMNSSHSSSNTTTKDIDERMDVSGSRNTRSRSRLIRESNTSVNEDNYKKKEEVDLLNSSGISNKSSRGYSRNKSDTTNTSNIVNGFRDSNIFSSNKDRLRELSNKDSRSSTNSNNGKESKDRTEVEKNMDKLNGSRNLYDSRGSSRGSRGELVLTEQLLKEKEMMEKEALMHEYFKDMDDTTNTTSSVDSNCYSSSMLPSASPISQSKDDISLLKNRLLEKEDVYKDILLGNFNAFYSQTSPVVKEVDLGGELRPEDLNPVSESEQTHSQPDPMIEAILDPERQKMLLERERELARKKEQKKVNNNLFERKYKNTESALRKTYNDNNVNRSPFLLAGRVSKSLSTNNKLGSVHKSSSYTTTRDTSKNNVDRFSKDRDNKYTRNTVGKDRNSSSTDKTSTTSKNKEKELDLLNKEKEDLVSKEKDKEREREKRRRMEDDEFMNVSTPKNKKIDADTSCLELIKSNSDKLVKTINYTLNKRTKTRTSNIVRERDKDNKRNILSNPNSQTSPISQSKDDISLLNGYKRKTVCDNWISEMWNDNINVITCKKMKLGCGSFSTVSLAILRIIRPYSPSTLNSALVNGTKVNKVTGSSSNNKNLVKISKDKNDEKNHNKDNMMVGNGSLDNSHGSNHGTDNGSSCSQAESEVQLSQSRSEKSDDEENKKVLYECAIKNISDDYGELSRYQYIREKEMMLHFNQNVLKPISYRILYSPNNNKIYQLLLPRAKGDLLTMLSKLIVYRTNEVYNTLTSLSTVKSTTKDTSNNGKDYHNSSSTGKTSTTTRNNTSIKEEKERERSRLYGLFEVEIKYLLIQILSGLSFIHMCFQGNILRHTDIKLTNILVFCEEDDRYVPLKWHLNLADFGCSMLIRPNQYFKQIHHLYSKLNSLGKNGNIFGSTNYSYLFKDKNGYKDESSWEKYVKEWYDQLNRHLLSYNIGTLRYNSPESLLYDQYLNRRMNNNNQLLNVLYKDILEAAKDLDRFKQNSYNKNTNGTYTTNSSTNNNVNGTTCNTNSNEDMMMVDTPENSNEKELSLQREMTLDGIKYTRVDSKSDMWSLGIILSELLKYSINDVDSMVGEVTSNKLNVFPEYLKGLVDREFLKKNSNNTGSKNVQIKEKELDLLNKVRNNDRDTAMSNKENKFVDRSKEIKSRLYSNLGNGIFYNKIRYHLVGRRRNRANYLNKYGNDMNEEFNDDNYKKREEVDKENKLLSLCINDVCNNKFEVRKKKLMELYRYNEVDGVDEKLVNLLTNLLSYEPEERLLSVEALGHPCFDDSEHIFELVDENNKMFIKKVFRLYNLNNSNGLSNSYDSNNSDLSNGNTTQNTKDNRDSNSSSTNKTSTTTGSNTNNSSKEEKENMFKFNGSSSQDDVDSEDVMEWDLDCYSWYKGPLYYFLYKYDNLENGNNRNQNKDNMNNNIADGNTTGSKNVQSKDEIDKENTNGISNGSADINTNNTGSTICSSNDNMNENEDKNQLNDSTFSLFSNSTLMSPITQSDVANSVSQVSTCTLLSNTNVLSTSNISDQINNISTNGNDNNFTSNNNSNNNTGNNSLDNSHGSNHGSDGEGKENNNENMNNGDGIDLSTSNPNCVYRLDSVTNFYNLLDISSPSNNMNTPAKTCTDLNLVIMPNNLSPLDPSASVFTNGEYTDTTATNSNKLDISSRDYYKSGLSTSYPSELPSDKPLDTESVKEEVNLTSVLENVEDDNNDSSNNNNLVLNFSKDSVDLSNTTDDKVDVENNTKVEKVDETATEDTTTKDSNTTVDEDDLNNTMNVDNEIVNNDCVGYDNEDKEKDKEDNMVVDTPENSNENEKEDVENVNNNNNNNTNDTSSDTPKSLPTTIKKVKKSKLDIYRLEYKILMKRQDELYDCNSVIFKLLEEIKTKYSLDYQQLTSTYASYLLARELLKFKKAPLE